MTQLDQDGTDSVSTLGWVTRAGALLVGIAVACGAFGAHALRGQVTERDLEIWETAVRYEAWHGLALFALPAIARIARIGRPRTIAIAWLAGTLVFSGSLYALVLTDVRVLGAVTPIGGVLMIAGWVVACVPGGRPERG
jgi:uncharacterized membrane protein YgdD (TMEM256/DUF423 family)